jgi:hypothetical protein
MLLGNIRKELLVSLSLLFASSSIAAPTVGDCERKFAAPVLSANLDASCFLSNEINQISEHSNPHLAGVAAELFKPPSYFDTQALSMHAKSLPPIPGTGLLVLAGFLCVTLVKDRRAWLGALAGLLWLGQTGFTALPQLASHLISKKQTQSAAGGANLSYVIELDGSFRPRSELEGREYIGLLRHLAGIPDETMSLPLPATPPSLQVQKAFSPERSRRGSNLIYSESAQSKHSFRLPQFALVTPLLHLIRIPMNRDSALKNKQLFPFSTSFTLVHLARSPPPMT